MIRTQIQLEDHIHRRVRQKALDERISMAELIRRLITQGLERGGELMSMSELSFIGAGDSMEHGVSELNDVQPDAKLGPEKGESLVDYLRGRGTVRMSTDEILALTRGEE